MQHNFVKRIAWFTENNSSGGSTSRSAYLTQNLVPALINAGVEVDLYSDNTSDFFISDQITLPVKHYLNAGMNNKQKTFCLFFHQIEEGKSAHFLRTALGLYPGVTYFHDLYLSDLGPDPLTNSPWSWVSQQLFSSTDHTKIEWPSRLKEFPRVGPFPQREVSLSLATISPTVRFCDDISRSEYANNKRNFFCPYPIPDKLVEQCKLIQRNTSDNLTVALFGSPNIEDRVHKLFLSLKDINKQIKIKWMLPRSQLSVAMKRAEEFNIQCEYFHEISATSWFDIVNRSNIAIHMRFSAFGTLSPYLDIALLTSRPVIVTDFGDSDYYPDDIVTKIPMGSFESYKINKVLTQFDQNHYKQNQSAQKFILENNQIQHVLHNILCAFNLIYNHSQQVSKRWNDLQIQAQAEFDEVLYQKEYRELGW